LAMIIVVCSWDTICLLQSFEKTRHHLLIEFANLRDLFLAVLSGVARVESKRVTNEPDCEVAPLQR